ncbi:MAG: S24 family peptidase [Bacteroidales bacterium]|nr:S24 family peptidase [Bacteroidales bacterium]MBD5217300.1 S24 family peptidase [Bacteroidales bacterium]MBD5221141.1 S24 family peptidase [Bacteroidales bacterium]
MRDSITRDRRIDRLDEYARIRGINDNRITKDCGLSLGTLGKSRKPGKDISLNTARKILDTYSDINRVWFLTGRGQMFESEIQPDFITYPLIDTSLAQCGKADGLSEASKMEDLPRIAIPGIPRETEFFIQATGHSMINHEHPHLSIPPSSLVGLSKINTGIIRWGEVYAVSTIDGIMIKRLLPDDNDQTIVRCLSYNSEEFPEFVIPKEEIKEVARITCVVPVMLR